ncbi:MULTISPECIES: glycine betaine ABC transporter substrate-binding protein [Streptomyces]|uniref:Glycine betaine ABC transporter substrate-binding protein n=1 Tax=Streptomyces lycii TaxID=2654337 RepID=A0ABQ7FPZ1_9ACTN|nr:MULTISPECIES: glycine betaine ABC transporter substrate-binding protein [Streptomyces]KAF4410994.1 glycine betaine ABC transporter substrate-binding protein [Streptomyces lycii]PGH50189.1 glycine/betaine ABC transporter substrate-binding protein [Streptomyces sp. Ru87]
MRHKGRNAAARTARTARAARTVRARRAARAAGGAALAGLLLAGCGLTSGSPMVDEVEPGSIGRGEPLEGAKLTVTSKQFTEQIILGQILGLAFKAAGAEVLDRTNIQGSIGSREAVRTGAADAGFEYTGTAWITYLGHTKPIVDPQEQWEAVRDEDRANGLTWLPPAELDNTYAFATTPATAEKYGLETISDVAELAKNNPDAATFCVEGEFAVREDGLPGLLEKYDFTVPRGNLRKMDSGIVYTQVNAGKACNIGEVYTTDGRIPELGLKVLEDDRAFFPNYNAAPMINTETLEEHPEIRKVLEPITAKLTTELAQKLNARVDVDGEDPHEVAKDWLVDEGFITEK